MSTVIESRRVELTSPSLFLFFLSASASFCAGTVLLLFAAGLDASGTLEQQASRAKSAKEDLDVLIAFLHEFGSVWPAARESSQVLTHLCVDYLLS